VVRQTGEMLRRTLRENIDIEIVLAGGPWRALADRGQTENALLNLALNAQDAMPGGGKLTIETANVRLDETYAVARFDVQPGQYVMVAVTDTGIGMPADVAARAFEPFYTTKPEGLGTGLGLSMVYGFVKQSGGHAAIYSEPAQGTTVKLYLPRILRGAVEATSQDAPPAPAPAGTVVLVVEDNDLVRTTAARMLKDLGYIVIKAPDGRQALQILQGTARVDLLFTDVVIPGGLGGRQLADAALRLRPGIRVVYTTGYAENAIVHQGRLDPDIFFLSKPYKRAELAARLRAALAAVPPEPDPSGPSPRQA
jgi:CheY-like chemotaxis protein